MNKTKINPEAIKTEEPFISMFGEIDQDRLASISLLMKERGFDSAQPVLVWEKGDENIVIDGHHRLEASKIAGIKSIDIIQLEFDSVEKALWYAKSIQFARRNLADEDKFSELLYIHQNKQLSMLPGEGRARDKVARLFGMSSAKAGRWLKVAKDGKEYHHAISEKKLTINKAWELVSKPDKPKPQKKELKKQEEDPRQQKLFPEKEAESSDSLIPTVVDIPEKEKTPEEKIVKAFNELLDRPDFNLARLKLPLLKYQELILQQFEEVRSNVR